MSEFSKIDSEAKPLEVFGAEVRRYRKRAGLTQDRLAELTMFSQSLIGFIERGERTPSRSFARSCDDALCAGGELIRLWESATRAASPQWFRGWLDIEKEAHTLHTWQPIVVPGLLQTEEYARAVLRGKPGAEGHEVEKKVVARMERQAIFSRSTPPMLWVVLDEGVLRRPIGGREVMRRQLERLLIASSSPRIAVQVLPLELGVATGVLGGFVIAQLPGARKTVYLESALNGQVTSRSEDVEAIQAVYDTIRAQAHPRHVSMELIRKAEKLWT
ncbi:helix-turn-helix transcriptional regulator [Streptosporangium sp. NPDC048047]|uniref:helix-turn-helix domain-containing protein n=1 Tax=Streptosporangium sp. NPDC048047 TaxID=3155748 RepID=UPI003420C1EF